MAHINSFQTWQTDSDGNQYAIVLQVVAETATVFFQRRIPRAHCEVNAFIGDSDVVKTVGKWKIPYKKAELPEGTADILGSIQYAADIALMWRDIEERILMMQFGYVGLLVFTPSTEWEGKFFEPSRLPVYGREWAVDLPLLIKTL